MISLKIPKHFDFFLFKSLIKKLLISSPKSIGKGGTPQSLQILISKGVLNKVLGLEWLMKKGNELKPI